MFLFFYIWHNDYANGTGTVIFTLNIPKLAYTHPYEGRNLEVNDVNSYEIMNYSIDAVVPDLRSLLLNNSPHRVNHRPINPLHHSDHFVAQLRLSWLAADLVRFILKLLNGFER
jgi:hypothetical protein